MLKTAITNARNMRQQGLQHSTSVYSVEKVIGTQFVYLVVK